jgi:hypothetical protein
MQDSCVSLYDGKVPGILSGEHRVAGYSGWQHSALWKEARLGHTQKLVLQQQKDFSQHKAKAESQIHCALGFAVLVFLTQLPLFLKLPSASSGEHSVWVFRERGKELRETRWSSVSTGLVPGDLGTHLLSPLHHSTGDLVFAPSTGGQALLP